MRQGKDGQGQIQTGHRGTGSDLDKFGFSQIKDGHDQIQTGPETDRVKFRQVRDGQDQIQTSQRRTGSD